MAQDQIKIDPVVLENIIAIIDRYVSNQVEKLNNLLSQMKTLSYDWQDEKTYGDMMKQMETVIKRACDMFEQMRMTYKKFFYNEVLDIRRILESLKV